MHFAFSMSTVLLSLVMVTQTLAVPGVGLEPRQCGSTCANGGTDFRQLGAPCSGCDPAAQNYGRVCSYNALAVVSNSDSIHTH